MMKEWFGYLQGKAVRMVGKKKDRRLSQSPCVVLQKTWIPSWVGWPRGGFTLIELIVVVMLFGIIVAIGYGSIRKDLPRYRLIQAAKGLESDIGKLRIAAISSSRETRLLLVSADPDPDDPNAWGGAWRLQGGNSSMMSTSWEDFPLEPIGSGDQDKSDGLQDIGEDGNRKARGVGLAPWSEIVGPGSGNANAIVFSPRGWVENPSSDFDSNGYITLELVNKPMLAEGVTDFVRVRIARSGYVRLETSLSSPREDFGVGTRGSSTNE